MLGKGNCELAALPEWQVGRGMQCVVCKSRYFFQESARNFVCLNQTVFGALNPQPVADCGMYTWRSDGSFGCARCRGGRYLHNGGCVGACPAGTTLRQLGMRQHGVDQVYVDQYNVCSDHLPNCAASFPYHDSAATVAYGCGKCLGNAVPVISAVNKQIVVAYTDPAT